MIKASYFAKVYCQIPYQGLRFSSAIIAPTSNFFFCLPYCYYFRQIEHNSSVLHLMAFFSFKIGHMIQKLEGGALLYLCLLLYLPLCHGLCPIFKVPLDEIYFWLFKNYAVLMQSIPLCCWILILAIYSIFPSNTTNF